MVSRHVATINWQRQSDGFNYQDYNRDHSWTFAGGTRVNASAAPEFLGTAENVDPEEAFVASVSACHMLTFLAICAGKKIIVNSYTDKAVGYLEKNNVGRPAVTRIELSPRIRFEAQPPEDKVVQEIHHTAHEQCFIANSIHTKVTVLRAG